MGEIFLAILKKSFQSIKRRFLETTETDLLVFTASNKLSVTLEKLKLIDGILARYRPKNLHNHLQKNADFFIKNT